MPVPHVEPYFALEAVTGDRLTLQEIEALLATIDPLYGLLECGRLDRVLTNEGWLGNSLQKEAADLAVDRHWKTKPIATHRVFNHQPVVFHERLLRVFIIHFASRLPAGPIAVPNTLQVTKERSSALALAAAALNDHIGPGEEDIRPTEPAQTRHVRWMVDAVGLNSKPDVLMQLGKARLLVAALTRQVFPSEEMASVLRVDLPGYFDRLLWIFALLFTQKERAFSNIRVGQFQKLSAAEAELAGSMLHDLSISRDRLRVESRRDLPSYRIAAFDRTPLLDLGEGQYMLCSLGSLMRQFRDGLRLRVHGRIPKEALGHLNDAWGHAMEDVLLGSLEAAIKARRLLDVRMERTKELDLAVAGRKSVLLFELKSPLFLRESLEAAPDGNPEEWIRSRIVDPGGKAGALDQLRRHIERLKKGELAVAGQLVPKDCNPVPVVVLAIPFHPLIVQNWLDLQARDSKVWPWPEIRPLVLPEQEFDALLALTERNRDPLKILGGVSARSIAGSLQHLATKERVGLSPQVYRVEGEAAFDAALATLQANFPESPEGAAATNVEAPIKIQDGVAAKRAWFDWSRKKAAIIVAAFVTVASLLPLLEYRENLEDRRTQRRSEIAELKVGVRDAMDLFDGRGLDVMAASMDLAQQREWYARALAVLNTHVGNPALNGCDQCRLHWQHAIEVAHAPVVDGEQGRELFRIYLGRIFSDVMFVWRELTARGGSLLE